MVLAFLAHRFAPSSRGLKRAEKKSTNDFRRVLQRKGGRRPSEVNNDDDGTDSDYHHMPNDDDNNNNSDSIVKEENHPWRRHPTLATGHRRKPFRAMALLTSVAADLDVIADWIFIYGTMKNDREYRRAWAQNSNNNNTAGNTTDGSLPYLIPPILLNLTFISCIVGTLMWIILATDGRVAAPLLRRLGIDKLSMGITLFLCVVLEDIPQVVLTFLIEDYYEEDQLSTIAVCNVMASLYDTLIKLAEAIDERNDMVETGAWCKHSISHAHTDTVSAIVTLLPPTNCDVTATSLLRNNNNNNASQPTWNNLQHMRSTRTLATTPLPSLRFLSASLDGTMRMWANINNHHRVDSFGYMVHDTVCLRTYGGVDSSSVTCLALLGEAPSCSSSQQHPILQSHISNSNSSHFLSGHQNGSVQLWHVDNSKEHVCEFQVATTTNSPVSGIAVVQVGILFVAAYHNGTSCLWNAWSGACLARYGGHTAMIRTICAMGDGQHFVTGSNDRTLRLWNVRSVLHQQPETSSTTESMSSTSSIGKNVGTLSFTSAPSDEQRIQSPNTEPIPEESVAVEIYQGHGDAVLAVAHMECGTMFVSGSLDCTARLWEINSGVCLQIFSGHSAGVSAVAAIDEVTLLTGSLDTTLKVWDALRGVCLRTYWGHTAVVTGISVTDDDTTFVTSSADRSINIWVLTALPTENDPSKTLDNMLEVNDGCCRGYEPE
jgi:WD40 repeat protein